MRASFQFLLGALIALISTNQAFAQSSHDAVSGAEADMPADGMNEFAIASSDGKYKMRFRGHLQQNNRFTYMAKTEKKDVDIEIKRARFTVTGHAFDPRLTYLLQTGFENDAPVARPADTMTSPGAHFLRDYYFNVACNPENFHVRVGKFRTPFSRQQLMSTSQMQFYDQSNANNEYQLTNTGRDVGIMFHNGFHNPLEWALAAVSNGVVARLGVNHNGIDGYEMTDFTGGDLRFAVAANGFIHTDYKTAKLDDMRGGADFIAKLHGFSTNGAFYYQYAKKEGQAAANHNYGAGADLGYLIHKKFEPVARYSWVKGAGDRTPHVHEVMAGVNYYIYGHHLKVQGYGGTQLANKEINKWTGGLQFQFAL